MNRLATRGSPSRFFERLALTGLALATVTLGALALWAAIATQNSATGLSRAGVQTSGHLRALQALSKIDSETDLLGEEFKAHGVRELRKAQLIFSDALERMERGGVVEASRIARKAQPSFQALPPSIVGLLAARRSGDRERLESADDATDRIVESLQLHLNDIEADPSRLLITKLEAVTAMERTVRRTAFVLVPLGLGLVGTCGWMLRNSRRRSEAVMRGALELSSREARTDQLTGLANRRALMEGLERHIEDQEPFMLALADLDGFKQYNDTYGHPAGDALLRRLGSKLQEGCAGSGTAARLGGDEFCVLFPEPGPLSDEEWDFMTEDRPYAAPRSVEDALAELRACSGTHFDPVAVEAFVDALHAGATARNYQLAA